MRIHRTTAGETWSKALLARRVARRRQCRLPHDARTRNRFRLLAYCEKMRGDKAREAEIYPVEIAWSLVGSFIGMALLALLGDALYPGPGNLLLMGTLGASAMLLFGAPAAPFSQPRNVVGGHVISALIGVTVALFLPPIPWLSAALSVSLAIAAMHVTSTLHPPGGGTALLMTTDPLMRELGYQAVIFPVLAGALVLLLTALAVNNISRRRRYPLNWW